MKSQEENTKGLHARYYIQKITKVANPNFSATAKQSQVINNHDPYINGLIPVDKDAEYFVLRLDTGGSDIEHIKACRIGIQAYANAIERHIPKLAKDLLNRYPALTAPSTHSSSEMVDKKAFAFTYEQLLTLPWYWSEENGEKFTHNYKPGYDNIDGNPQYFGTSKKGMRIISVNADYVGHTYVEILCDGGTRKVFNGYVRSFEELQLINSLVL